ncbi:MAG: hypothetical protein PHW46_05810, partial [Candidatus Omnitrophica bacterium]|nr:hypothetical protein [Candidatus Omnitrophota bacterium]
AFLKSDICSIGGDDELVYRISYIVPMEAKWNMDALSKKTKTDARERYFAATVFSRRIRFLT